MQIKKWNFGVNLHKRKKSRLWFFCYSLLCLITFFSDAFAIDTIPTVNILTWWDYLKFPWIKPMVYNACHVNLSIDEYYSGDEFLRRWKQYKDSYDIVIFEDIMFNTIKNDIVLKDSNLSTQSKNYNKTIKKRFLSQNYPTNVAYFYQAVTGFLWNPKIIRLDEKDTLTDIFKKSQQKIVILIDDPITESNLILNDNNRFFNSVLNNNLIQNIKLYITNDYAQLYKKSDFAFSYTWSGVGAAVIKQSNEKYLFSMTPKYSFVSSDLIAQLNNKKYVNCVSHLISSQSFLSLNQNETFYFSPYGNTEKITNMYYLKLYKEYLKKLPKLTWINPISKNDFLKINRQWQLKKIQINQINNNEN